MTFSVQPNFFSTLQRPSLDTMSNAFEKSINTAYSSMFCLIHYSRICLSLNTMSMVLWLFLKPLWVLDGMFGELLMCPAEDHTCDCLSSYWQERSLWFPQSFLLPFLKMSTMFASFRFWGICSVFQKYTIRSNSVSFNLIPPYFHYLSRNTTSIRGLNFSVSRYRI